MHFGGILPQSKGDGHDLNHGKVGSMVGIMVIIVLVEEFVVIATVIKNVVVVVMVIKNMVAIATVIKNVVP